MLSATGETSPPPAETAATPATAAGRPAERRQLTVMFCDLVGSTSLSALLDPEELREVIRAYQTATAEVIESYDGYIAQYLGDGILAYFGFPKALENEAGRAVRAGRDVVAAVRLLNERLERPAGVALSARVGIHTGVVVIGEIGGGSRREHLALGETPNVAARIQAAAEPDQVVLSGDTYSLVRSDFVCERLGTQTIRGISEPVELYRAEGEQSLAVSNSSRPMPEPRLIGREAELDGLREHWVRASGGAGEIVLIGGDAGLGKSALARTFARSLANSPATVLTARCLPYFRSSALQPMAELVRRWLQLEPDNHSARTREALRSLLERYRLGEDLPLFASLLGLRNKEREAIMGPTAPQWRERMASGLTELILRAAKEQPVLLCIEDLHWADPSTLDVLGGLVAQLPERAVLAIFTHRPEFQIPWGDPPRQSHLVLPRLAPGETEELIATFTNGRSLPVEVTAQIVERTDGVPFFVEELTRMVLESGLLREGAAGYELVGGELPPLAIPLTLHDSLEARLERLASTKGLAQLGAVLGREFSYELIRAVTEADEATLQAALDQLVEADLLVRAGAGTSTVYTFKHGLIQEVAYQSLLRGVRQTYHLRVGSVLENRFPERAAAHPEVVAQHYSGAGMNEHAIDLWTRAGLRAVERSANREAILHLRQGLELLKSTAEGPARRKRELALLLALGPALIATLGHASEEVRDSYARAHALVDDDTDAEQRLEILTGLVTAYFVRSEMLEARQAAEEMLRLAQSTGNPGREMAASVALGVALLGAGAVEPALSRLEEGIAHYDAARDFPLAHSAGQDFGVVAMAYSAYALCALGRPLRASERIEEALRLARSLDHPHSLAFALAFACSVAYFRRDPELAVEPLAELVALARRERFQHWLSGAAPLEAWILGEEGDTEAAITRLRQSDAAAATRGRTDIQVTFWMCIAAEVFLRAGHAEDALALLEDVIAIMASHPTRLWWIAEAYRLRAGALATTGRLEEADADLVRAAEEATAAGARLFLLRALVDRARLFPDRTAGAEALRALAGLYPSFQEGQELEDLRAARTLLEARTHSVPTR